MTTPHRTLQMALDALDAITDDVDGTGLNTMPSFDKAIDAIAALREALAQPEPEPAAHLYDDGTWIATQTAAGRSLNDRMLFAGSPKIGVYTVATPPAAPIDGFGGNLDEAFERAPAVPVSWDRLRTLMDGIPTREEFIGGQRQKYVAKEEVMGWLYECQLRAEREAVQPAAPTVQVVLRQPNLFASAPAVREPLTDARKLCTCDGAGRGPGRACVVQAGGRLGDLWKCAKSAASAVPSDAALNTLAKLFHNGEEIEGDDGAAMMVDLSLWHEASEAFDSLIGDGDGETLASPAAPAEPVSREHAIALRDAELYGCEDMYFAARPQIDTLQARRIYAAGFKAGYEVRPLAQPLRAEPVALESVHLTRDIKGMCTVRVNGRVAIQDNGDIIDHMATLEWFAQPAPVPLTDTETHAELWKLAVRKGLVTVRSELIDPRNHGTRVSWMQGHDKACDISNDAAAHGIAASPAAPAAPVPLTQDQIADCTRTAHRACDAKGPMTRWSTEFARAIEAAHGITGGKP